MLRLLILLVLIDIAVTAAALIITGTSDEEDFAVLPRWLWMLIILCVPLLGTALWYRYGRRHAPPRRTSAPPPRPLAPDDDPEFLRSLERRRKDNPNPEP